MNTYQVLFDTKNHKRVSSTAFVVPAQSASEATAIATRLLRQCGENALWFKNPKTRQLTNEEQLAMIG